MTNFNDFISACGQTLNHHQLTIKDCFDGWKRTFDKIRSGTAERLRPGFSQPVVQGVITYSLSDEEAFFILSYTASFSSWINLPLRRGDVLTECQQYYAKGLELALAALPACNCDYLYRLDMPMCDKKEELEWFARNVGSIIQVPSFLSVAKSNWDNTNITWKIATNNGHSNAVDLALCRNNASEDEAVFKPNSLFKIIGIEQGIVLLEEVENTTLPFISMVGNYAGC